MSENATRDVIFEKIKSALESKTKVTKRPTLQNIDSIYTNSKQSLEITFAEELTKLNGKFVFCENFKEFTQNIRTLFKQEKLNSFFCQDKAIQQIFSTIDIPFTSGEADFLEMKAAVTGCEYIVARTGSVVVSSAQNTSKRVYAFAPIHIVFATTSQLVYDISDANKLLMEKYVSNLPSMISIISGPSIVLNTTNTENKSIETNKLYVFLINS